MYCPLINAECRKDCILGFKCADPECKEFHCELKFALSRFNTLIETIHRGKREDELPETIKAFLKEMR